MINPDIKIAKSTGIDRPIMYVYLAGRIAGNCIEKCIGWRREIINHYRNYKPLYITHPDTRGEVLSGYESYPIAFLDPLNSGEADSVDKLGLTSSIPPNLIYDKDEMSVKRADVVVANVEDYFEVGIEEEMAACRMISVVKAEKKDHVEFIDNPIDYKEAFYKLQTKIKERRENFGTISEIAWALFLRKPLILIVPEARKEIYMKHPFAKRASVIVTSVDELLKSKCLNILYKSMAGAAQ